MGERGLRRPEVARRAETVDADPELRVQERRTRFYGSLQRATKAFEEPTSDDVRDFAEDDMVRQLEELQHAIATCLSAPRGLRDRPSRYPGGAE